MHGGINVDILQVLQGLCVEEAQGGPRREGDPNADPRHGHVGDDHPFVLVGLQLILGEQKEIRSHGVSRGTARVCNSAVGEDAAQWDLD